MDQLWAPWRMQYIMAPKAEDCIFCTKPLVGDDSATHIVSRGDSVFVMLNAYPYNNGHLMISPFAHVAGLEDLEPPTLLELMTVCQDAIRVLKRHFNPEGVNVGLNLGAAAGAGVKDHLHLHVVPRWHGDTNFMPVVSDVRVIPQALDHAFEILRKGFEELGRH